MYLPELASGRLDYAFALSCADLHLIDPGPGWLSVLVSDLVLSTGLDAARQSVVPHDRGTDVPHETADLR
jgi:hypothetical protein